MEFGSIGFQTNSQITGPWNTRDVDGEGYWNDVEAARSGGWEKRKSYVMGTSPRYSVDKKQVVVEKTTEVEGDEHPCFG